ncbi:hypothetical protein HPB47_010358 [Ixodes persulcatus]|uniref:Uncharacterized protein n=1 Tax=Ixodes persulcatus TaxID=34615 RepID=A0AC60NZK3_IXOPE|nr:hypothetical protein HPB47_010358 [Ixodes persulcatus]
MSDKEIVRQSRFLPPPSDLPHTVTAENGFLTSQLLSQINVKLDVPPFLGQGTLSKTDVRETENVASLGIHIKRRIERIKSFYIFDRAIPLSLGPVVNEVWTICTILTNLQSPLVRQHLGGIGDVD